MIPLREHYNQFKASSQKKGSEIVNFVIDQEEEEN